MRCGWPSVATGSSIATSCRCTSTSSAAADPSRINAAVGDARDLDLGDGTVDAVLLLGPLYHLRRRQERLGALREAWRVVSPGGPVFVAAISRWAPRLDGELRARLYESLPAIRELTPAVERTGWLPPLFPGSFSAYCHRPRQLRAELYAAGFQVLDLVAVEGMGFVLSDLDERLADPLDRAVVLDAARATERVPELLGIGPHLLATAVRQCTNLLMSPSGGVSLRTQGRPCGRPPAAAVLAPATTRRPRAPANPRAKQSASCGLTCQSRVSMLW